VGVVGGLPELVTAADVAAASMGKVSPADPRLPALVAGASDGVRLACGWHVAPVVRQTLVLDGTGGSVMQLPSGHVTGVEAVRVDGADVEFDWSAAGMVSLRSGCFPERFRCVEVTLTHGWPSAPAVVAVVVQAVLGAAASPMGATREQAGQVAVSWARTGLALSAEDRVLLAPYTLQNWA